MSWKDLLYKSKKEEVIAPPPIVNQPTVVTNYNMPQATNNIVSNEYVDSLRETLRGKRSNPLDFLTFMEHVETLNDQILTDQQRYTFAYPSYKNMGITPEKLIESGNTYLQLLNEEENTFNQSINEAKVQQISSNEESIAQMQQEIGLLQQQIVDKTQRVQQLQMDVSESKLRLSSEENKFSLAVTSMRSKIENQIINIKKYLNGTITK